MIDQWSSFYFVVDWLLTIDYISYSFSRQFLDNQNIAYSEIVELYWSIVWSIDQGWKTCVWLSINEVTYLVNSLSLSPNDEKLKLCLDAYEHVGTRFGKNWENRQSLSRLIFKEVL